MELITNKEKIEAALNNDEVTRVIATRLNHPQYPCVFSDDLMSKGERVIFDQRSKENAKKIANFSIRLGLK